MSVWLETYLSPTMVRQFDSVVRDELVDVAVLVPFGLGMPDQNDHLCIRLATHCTKPSVRVYPPEACP